MRGGSDVHRDEITGDGTRAVSACPIPLNAGFLRHTDARAFLESAASKSGACMSGETRDVISAILAENETQLISEWLDELRQQHSRAVAEAPAQLGSECSKILRSLKRGLCQSVNSEDAAFADVRDLLARLSREHATHGFSPRDTAVVVLSLKKPLFSALQREAADVSLAAQAAQDVGQLLDGLGLFTMEAYQQTRESIIVRQQQEISELSTPVIKLWHGILALPLIGTLDSQRTQVVTESLLQAIAEQNAATAIIDITGVPVVDTLTAQYLLTTVAAARLMGATCIISGIRPQIAQTMVHLGIELDVVSKASLADAFALALRLQGRTVTRIKPIETVRP